MNQAYSAGRALRRRLLPAVLLALAFVFVLVPAMAHAGPLGDITAPVSVSDVEASYIGPAAIHITAQDLPGGSVETSVVTGVKSITYSVDLGSDVVVLGASATVNVAALGPHSVTFFATDNDGNVEAPKTGYFTVNDNDFTPPMTISDREAVYLNSGVIHFFAVDDTGVEATYYILDGGTPTQGTEVAFDTYGHHTLSYWSVDLAGNVEEPTETFFEVYDSIAPVTTSNAKPDYYNSHAAITLSATDAKGSGVAATYYKLDGGADVTGTTVTCDVLGAHTLAFWSEDTEGNVEAAKTATFTVNAGPAPGGDIIAPVSTSNAQATYATSPATVKLTSTDEDGGSGMKSLSYKVDGGGTIVVTSTPTASALQALTMPITPTIMSPATHHNGSGTATVNSCDCHTPNGCGECHDVAAAPDITSEDPKPANHSHITVTPCTGCHVVTEVEPEPGAKTISKDVVVAGNGSHTIEFWGEDVAGNVETPHKSVTFRIGPPADTVAPVIAIGGVTDGGVYTAAVTPTFSAVDAVDGPVASTATLNGAAFTSGTAVSANGAYTLVVTAKDAANNTATKTVAFTINAPADTLAPEISVFGVVDDGVYTAPVTVSFMAIDAHDGLVASTATLDGAAFVSGSVVSALGSHTLVVTAKDAANNTATKTVDFTINAPADTVAPVITVLGVVDGAVYTTNVAPTFAAIDAHDGLVASTATLNGAAFVSGTVVTAPGAYTLVVTAKDAANNTATKTVAFTISAPEEEATATYLSVRFAETTASSYGIPYGASAYLTVEGILVEADNTANRVSGQTVDLWTSFDGTHYTKSSAAVAEAPGDPGLYSVRVKVTQRTWYRLRFAGSEDYGRSLGRTLNAGPKAWLTAPNAPSTMDDSRSYSVSGYLKPQHYGSPVKIYAYQKIGGVWTVRASFLAKASVYSTYSRYVGSIRLPSAGAWRIRAYHRDNAGGVHYASYSSWRYITVE